jgi:hypothetical protein
MDLAVGKVKGSCDTAFCGGSWTNIGIFVPRRSYIYRVPLRHDGKWGPLGLVVKIFYITRAIIHREKSFILQHLQLHFHTLITTPILFIHNGF